ncbi:POK9 protein, partial [Phaetusa simplex]|nr:POK9 protein [Phaetusa simplex]
AGSAGLDLATSEPTIITDTSVCLLPTGVYGPLPRNSAALLIGRSSTTCTGLFLLPGVIDSDYKGEIKIMAWTPKPPCTIPQGEKITQLIPFPVLTSSNGTPRNGGFGSTGVPQILWTQKVSSGQPVLSCKINGKLFSGLVDTGADVTIVQ